MFHENSTSVNTVCVLILYENQYFFFCLFLLTMPFSVIRSMSPMKINLQETRSAKIHKLNLIMEKTLILNALPYFPMEAILKYQTTSESFFTIEKSSDTFV